MTSRKYVTGNFQVNTYLIYDEESKEAAIIDMGGESDELFTDIETLGLNIKFILNTHGHFDHTSGAKLLQEKFDVPFYVGEEDSILVENLSTQCLLYGFDGVEPPVISGYLDESSELKLGEKSIRVIATPGHTKGGLCFLFDGELFSGDTLFHNTVGRTDLPGGSYEEIISSVKDKLFLLPDETPVFPGHDTFTTIGREKFHNPYFS